MLVKHEETKKKFAIKICNKKYLSKKVGKGKSVLNLIAKEIAAMKKMVMLHISSYNSRIIKI